MLLWGRGFHRNPGPNYWSLMTHHLNNGRCPKCAEIMGRFPGLYRPLRAWFVYFQNDNPEAHVSEAGRGREKQELEFSEGDTKAHWLESAHNWNAALDIFIQLSGHGIYDREWFTKVLAPEIPKTLVWYGRPDCTFREFPHVEVAGWKKLRDSGLLVPVETT